jgi:hypothetical protein
LERRVLKIVRYCVQPYERKGKRLAKGEPLQFHGEHEALKAAQRMQRRVAGATVYEVTGWPVQDLWGKPRLLAKYGETA